jgi:hypothetical protein
VPAFCPGAGADFNIDNKARAGIRRRGSLFFFIVLCYYRRRSRRGITEAYGMNQAGQHGFYEERA